MATPDATWDVRWLEECDSTNRLALDLARDGAPHGVVIVADHQTAGRGRLGRSWYAPPGASLLMSVLLRPADGLPVERAHRLTMAVGVAAAGAAEALGAPVRLKWPNDLLLDGRKLGGILAESLVAGGRVAAVVVGVGINVNWPAERPAEIATTSAALSDVLGRQVDRRALLDAILAGLEQTWTAGEDLDRRYRDLCDTLGRDVRVELTDAAFEGRAVDVDADGRLLVDVGGDVRVVAVGDVVHLR